MISDIDTTDIDRILDRSRTAIERGVAWIASKIGHDGEPGATHGHYYRVPWTLAIAGQRPLGAASLSWIEREALTEDGDLRAGPPRSGFEMRWSSYPLANLATGAWHLERYDTAKRIVQRLHAFQHPETGGAFTGHPDHRVDQRQDLFPTAQLGMTGLTTGSMDLAHGAYRWMRDLYASQPELPTKLYTAMDRGGLMVETSDDEDLEWQVVTNFHKPRQAFYNPGIAAAFLGRYYMATGAYEALRLARDYLELTASGSDIQFDFTQSVQVCKFAWGSSVLLEATGESRYLDYALNMAEWFCEAQRSDGSWDNSPFLMEKATDPDSVRTEITAEFVQHLVTTTTAIGGMQRPTSVTNDVGSARSSQDGSWQDRPEH